MTAPAYCTRADLALVGVSPDLYAGHTEITDAVLESMIAIRSGYAGDYLARYYQLPLVSWGQSLSLAVAQLVAWDLACRLGHNPDDAGTSVWRDRRDEALATLERIAKFGSPGIVDSTPTVVESGWSCSSERRRGW